MNEQDRQKRSERILAMYRETRSIGATVRRLKVGIHTVRKVLRGMDHPRSTPVRVKQKSKLEPYRAVIERLVVIDGLTAVLVLEHLRKLGYEGGYSILKRHVRTIRPNARKRVTTRLEHEPGAEGQVDWSPYSVSLGGEVRIVHAFSMVLPFSRFMVIRMALDEQLDTLLTLHEEAFSILGGYPAVMTYDNMTTVGRHIKEGEVWINPRFEEYRRRCGFALHLIDPGRPTQHGSVERPFHYFEHNCLLRRGSNFADFEDLQNHVRTWCDEVANVRIHGTTRERPCDRFKRERLLLLPRPEHRPDMRRKLFRGVGDDFCIAFDTNRYSVPPRYVGMPATILVKEEEIEILIEGAVVALHPICRERLESKVLPEHEQEFKKSTTNTRLLEQAFIRLGPVAHDYYQGLKTSRGRGAGFHLSRLLKLTDRYGVTKVTGAMAHAARFGNYSAEAVVRVLSGRELTTPPSLRTLEVQPPPEQVRRWLEGLEVESKDLSDYDRLIEKLAKESGEGDE